MLIPMQPISALPPLRAGRSESDTKDDVASAAHVFLPPISDTDLFATESCYQGFGVAEPNRQYALYDKSRAQMMSCIIPRPCEGGPQRVLH